MNDLAALSTPVIAGVGILIVVQLSLQIAALVSLVRTPAERITIGGRKWVWALIIILGEIVGPILYFVLGKTPAPADDVAAAVPAAQRAATAADTLYGAATPAPQTPAASTATPAQQTPAAGAADTEPQDPAAGADGTGMGELP